MSVGEMNDKNATITYLVIVMTAWNLSHGLFHVFRQVIMVIVVIHFVDASSYVIMVLQVHLVIHVLQVVVIFVLFRRVLLIVVDIVFLVVVVVALVVCLILVVGVVAAYGGVEIFNSLVSVLQRHDGLQGFVLIDKVSDEGSSGTRGERAVLANKRPFGGHKKAAILRPVVFPHLVEVGQRQVLNDGFLLGEFGLAEAANISVLVGQVPVVAAVLHDAGARPQAGQNRGRRWHAAAGAHVHFVQGIIIDAGGRIHLGHFDGGDGDAHVILIDIVGIMHITVTTVPPLTTSATRT